MDIPISAKLYTINSIPKSETKSSSPDSTTPVRPGGEKILLTDNIAAPNEKDLQVYSKASEGSLTPANTPRGSISGPTGPSKVRRGKKSPAMTVQPPVQLAEMSLDPTRYVQQSQAERTINRRAPPADEMKLYRAAIEKLQNEQKKNDPTRTDGTFKWIAIGGLVVAGLMMMGSGQGTTVGTTYATRAIPYN